MTVTRRFSDPEAERRLGEAYVRALARLLDLRRQGYANFAVDDQIAFDEDVDYAYARARSHGLAERVNDVLRHGFPGQPAPAADGLLWPEAGRVLIDIEYNVRLNAGDVRGLHERLYVRDDGTRQGFYMSQLARLLRERVAYYDDLHERQRDALDRLIEHLCSKALALVLDLDVLELLRLAGCESEFADVPPSRQHDRRPAPQSPRPTDGEWAARLADVHLQTLRELLDIRRDWYDALCIHDQLRIDADADRAFHRYRSAERNDDGQRKASASGVAQPGRGVFGPGASARTRRAPGRPGASEPGRG